MILLLKKAGWYEGRFADITEFEQQCINNRLELFDSAKKFLQEFYGIDEYVLFKSRNSMKSLEGTWYEYEFLFKLNLDREILKYKDFKSILSCAKEDCFYIGESGYYYSAVVAIGRSGKLYFKHDYTDKVQVFDTLLESMESEVANHNILTYSLYMQNDIKD